VSEEELEYAQQFAAVPGILLRLDRPSISSSFAAAFSHRTAF